MSHIAESPGNSGAFSFSGIGQVIGFTPRSVISVVPWCHIRGVLVSRLQVLLGLVLESALATSCIAAKLMCAVSVRGFIPRAVEIDRGGCVPHPSPITVVGTRGAVTYSAFGRNQRQLRRAGRRQPPGGLEYRPGGCANRPTRSSEVLG